MILPLVRSDALENGLHLRSVEMKALPIASLAVLFRAGGNSDPAGKEGLAHLAGSSLDAGTVASDIHELAGRIEFLGTSLHVTTMHDATSIVCSTLTRHMDELMSILGEILCTATFPSHEIERLRINQTTSLMQMHDRPGVRASQVLDRVLFGDVHPYGRSILGVRRSIEGLTRGDAEDFFKLQYRPGNSFAIVTGDVSVERWRALCSRHLGGWAGMTPAGEAQPETGIPEEGRIFVVDRPDTPQSEVRMGCVAMPRNHPEYLAASVLNHCLGGQFNSRLNRSLREQRGLTYGAWSAFSALRSSGSFVQGGAFQTERTDEAVGVMIEEVRRIRAEGISGEELRYAQQSMSGSFLRSFETPSQVNGRLQTLYAYDMPDSYYSTYLEKLGALTVEEIHRVARRWLPADRFAVVVVGDSHSLKEPLERLNLGTVVDYDDA